MNVSHCGLHRVRTVPTSCNCNSRPRRTRHDRCLNNVRVGRPVRYFCFPFFKIPHESFYLWRNRSAQSVLLKFRHRFLRTRWRHYAEMSKTQCLTRTRENWSVKFFFLLPPPLGLVVRRARGRVAAGFYRLVNGVAHTHTGAPASLRKRCKRRRVNGFHRHVK